MPRGGKDRNQGRKPGVPNKNLHPHHFWEHTHFKLSPDAVEFLSRMREMGYTKSNIVNAAVLAYSKTKIPLAKSTD